MPAGTYNNTVILEEQGQSHGEVVAVSLSGAHTFSKRNVDCVRLIAGIGVDGDAHSGEKVKHRYLVGLDPDKPNLRQAHLIHAELHDELRSAGFAVGPGQMGENVTTRGIPLLDLPTGTLLHIGPAAVLEVTGLRSPCSQIDKFQKGLLAAVLDRDPDGNLIRKSGIMSIVKVGGDVRPGDTIVVELPAEPHVPLTCV